MNPQIYMAVVQDPGTELVIGFSDRDGARLLADQFEETFLQSLDFDHSEIAFDGFRVVPVGTREIEEMLGDVLGDYETVDEVLEEISTKGALVLLDESDAVSLADEVSREYQ